MNRRQAMREAQSIVRGICPDISWRADHKWMTKEQYDRVVESLRSMSPAPDIEANEYQAEIEFSPNLMLHICKSGMSDGEEMSFYIGFMNPHTL